MDFQEKTLGAGSGSIAGSQVMALKRRKTGVELVEVRLDRQTFFFLLSINGGIIPIYQWKIHIYQWKIPIYQWKIPIYQWMI